MKYPYLITLIYILFAGNLTAQKINVVSSASIFNDMVKQIAGDKVNALSIVPIGGDPHIYEPTPSDAKDIQDAQLILVNGMTFEGWIDEVIENSGTKGKRILITEGVQAIESEQYKNSSDPHAWMDASNGLIYIKNIKEALVEADPVNADFYTTNYKLYSEKLLKLDGYIREEIKKIPVAKRVLITSHDAFSYYAKRYGIKNNAIMGISTEAEAQTSDIMRVAKSIKESGVPAIFIESTINPKMINQIAKDNDVIIGGELFADSTGDEDSHAPTYYDMLKYNTDTIVKALTSKGRTETKSDEDLKSNSYLPFFAIGVVMIIALVLMVKKMNN